MRGVKRDWTKLDKLYEKSNLSFHGFCSKYNIPKSTMRNHMTKKKANKTAPAEELTEIVPVDIFPDVGKKEGFNADSGSIRLKINDVEIVLNEGFNKVLLKEVLDVLRPSC